MSDSSTVASTHRQRLLEIALVFTRLGFTAFGGPMAHVALMEQELVARRKWLTRQQFLDAYAAINFIPGPASTELAIYLGQIRAGFMGLVVAGCCFIAPAFLIILPIAYAYVNYGQAPAMQGLRVGINSAVVAIIATACIRFARQTLTSPFLRSVSAVVLGIQLALMVIGFGQIDLTLLASAAIAGATHRAIQPRRPTRTMPALALIPVMPVLGATTLTSWFSDLFELGAVFLKIGATLFGSGYLLVAYLQQSVVERHGWMTPDQMLTAVSVGQLTPGPLLTTATFIGYFRGQQIFQSTIGAVIGAIVATVAIFVPAFVVIAVLGRYLKLLRSNRYLGAALDGVNAAVVSLIALTALRLAIAAFAPAGHASMLAIGICAISLTVLSRFGINATWAIAFGAVAGWAGMHYGMR